MLSLSLLSFDASAQKRRAVQMPSTERVTLIGEVRDAASNAPVVMAEVAAAGDVARTDRAGKFTIPIPKGQSVAVTVSRSGYEKTTTTLKLTANSSQNFQLTSRPTTRIVTAEKTYIVDDDTLEFGYAIPFQGFHRDRVLKLCRAGESKVDLDRTEIRRIVGPMTTATEASCCSTPVSGMSFTRGSGMPIVYYFADSCLGYPILVFGRDHATWDVITVRLADVQEVALP
jgi:hypothetical protein